MNHLEKLILATICYFDIFDYPLTLVEIWKWLFIYPELKNLRTKELKNERNEELMNRRTDEPKNSRTEEQIKIFDIQNVLDTSDYLKQGLETKNGFYSLRGRIDLVKTRMERYNIAERKYKKALKIIKILRLVPFVKMMAVCNTLACSNSRDESDIDLFIICEKGHLWQIRFLISGFLKLFNLRPTALETKDKICASFFLSEDNLNIRNLSIADDIYLKYWLTQVYPVCDNGIYQKFLSVNDWIKNDIPNFFPVQPTLRRQLKPGRFKLIFRLIFSILSENYCKNYQWKILPENLRKIVNKDTRVVMNNQVLKFHDNDAREFYRDSFHEKIRKLL